MPRCLFIGPLLLPLPLFTAPPEDKLVYTVDARLSTCLRQEMSDLELSKLLLGLRQAYRGEAFEIPPKRIERLLLQYESATTETPRIAPAEARFPTNEKVRFGVRELIGGVPVSESRRGQGSGIGAATQVHVRYRGLLANGQVFDQNKGVE